MLPRPLPETKATPVADLAIEVWSVTCYVYLMATTPKKAKPRTPRERMASRRERLRAQGLRPVQHWVPDLRDPKVLAGIRREVKLMAQHPENDAIDDWIEQVYDWESWK
jgi:hypothetical protein